MLSNLTNAILQHPTTSRSCSDPLSGSSTLKEYKKYMQEIKEEQPHLSIGAQHHMALRRRNSDNMTKQLMDDDDDSADRQDETGVASSEQQPFGVLDTSCARQLHKLEGMMTKILHIGHHLSSEVVDDSTRSVSSMTTTDVDDSTNSNRSSSSARSQKRFIAARRSSTSSMRMSDTSRMKMNELLSELDDDENYEEELDSIEKGCDVPAIENSDAKFPSRCANARRASSF